MSKPNKDGWVRHRGGKCPVDGDAKVDYRVRDGEIDCFGRDAGRLAWSHNSDIGDIMAYRIHKPAEQPVIEPAVVANVQALNEIHSLTLNHQLVGRIERKNPLQWRDRITEIDSTVEALEEERVSLVQRLEAEGFRLIERVVEHEAQQPDPGHWMIGDSVECISSNYSFITVGTVYVITGFDRNMVQFLDDDETEMEYGLENFKFHSRPYK